jgi:hypothetical protein
MDAYRAAKGIDWPVKSLAYYHHITVLANFAHCVLLLQIQRANRASLSSLTLQAAVKLSTTSQAGQYDCGN